MFLTEARIDSATALRQGLRDLYDWHQAVWRAFPGRNGQRRAFLSRLDYVTEGFRLLIASEEQPVKPGWVRPVVCAWRTMGMPSDYFTQRCYRFDLRANPTKKMRVGSIEAGTRTKNGHRVAIGADADLVRWIQRKAEAGGFTVVEDTLCIVRRPHEFFERHGVRGAHAAVDFRGVLRVVDASAFYETFRRGIGSAKAFGFGMLVIVPMPDGPTSQGLEPADEEKT